MGTYLTDGVRLVYVLGDMENGGLFTEDVVSNSMVPVFPKEIEDELWRPIVPKAA